MANVLALRVTGLSLQAQDTGRKGQEVRGKIKRLRQGKIGEEMGTLLCLPSMGPILLETHLINELSLEWEHTSSNLGKMLYSKWKNRILNGI